MNSNARLRSVPSIAPAKRNQSKPTALCVVDQVRLALRPKNRLPTILGGILGGGVPVASYVLAHCEIDSSAPLYGQLAAWLVLGALFFSATSVFGWARQAFQGSGCKALGFTVLLEGVLVAAHTPWLSVAALAYLVGINAIATGCSLSLASKKSY